MQSAGHLLETSLSLQDLRYTVGASKIPIAPADRGAHLTRFPSLATFKRRPTGHGTCCELGEWGRHPKPVTRAAVKESGRCTYRGGECILIGFHLPRVTCSNGQSVCATTGRKLQQSHY